MNKAPAPGAVISADTAAALMAPLTELAMRAGAAILAVNRGAMKVEGKSDGSPVTEADLAADRIIGEGLARLVPLGRRAHQRKAGYKGRYLFRHGAASE